MLDDTDCNDLNDAAWPLAPEYCDGVDNAETSKPMKTMPWMSPTITSMTTGMDLEIQRRCFPPAIPQNSM